MSWLFQLVYDGYGEIGSGYPAFAIFVAQKIIKSKPETSSPFTGLYAPWRRDVSPIKPVITLGKTIQDFRIRQGWAPVLQRVLVGINNKHAGLRPQAADATNQNKTLYAGPLGPTDNGLMGLSEAVRLTG